MIKSMKKNKSQSGFTLIELLIAIAIVGILLAVAIPTYTDYTARAKVSEALIAASSAKATVSEFFISVGRMPADLDEAGFSEDQFDSFDNVENVSGELVDDDFVISVQVTANIHEDIEADTSDTFTLSAVGNSAGVTWTCAAGTLPSKFLPANCRISQE